MTAKRFVDYFDKDHNYIIQDLQNEDEYQVGFVNCDEDVFLGLINQLNDENEQLKQRNENQYQQLNKLWGLIQAKDWETLTAMDNQIKEDEERLQREWRTYE